VRHTTKQWDIQQSSSVKESVASFRVAPVLEWMFSIEIKGNYVTKLAVKIQVMFTEADVTRKPKGVTH
jgi:hypothetical protein